MWWWAVAGAAVNQISTAVQSVDDQARLRKQKQQAQQAFDYETQYRDKSYNLQRQQSLETLGIQRNRLAEALGTDVEGFNLGLAGQAEDNQAARVAMSDSAGMARVQQGMSGTRGSDTMDKRIAFQENQLDTRMSLQDRSNSLNIQNMSRQYSNQFSDIGREIDSWGANGYRGRAKTLEDTYRDQLHGLKMDEYDSAIKDAGYTFWDFMYSGLTGAGQGMSMGLQVNALKQQLGSGGGGGGTTGTTGGAGGAIGAGVAGTATMDNSTPFVIPQPDADMGYYTDNAFKTRTAGFTGFHGTADEAAARAAYAQGADAWNQWAEGYNKRVDVTRKVGGYW